MKKKLFVMSMFCLALTTVAHGQQTGADTLDVKADIPTEYLLQSLKPTYLRNANVASGWGSNWFVEVKGGASAFMGSPLGCGDVFDRVTPAFQVGIGKWFTPAVGGRLAFQGFQFKNAEFARMDYQFVHADFMYNLTAFVRQNEQGLSRWDVIPFLGIGMAHNSDWNANGVTGHVSGSHPFAFAYGLEARYHLTDRLHLTAELSGMTTMKNFDAIGTASRFGDNMLTLGAGLSVTLGKVGFKRVVDARPYITQNDWLMKQYNSLSEGNHRLSKRLKHDERCLAEYRKILEIEGLLDLYKGSLSDVDNTTTKSLYPKNDYSGLNSLKARLANKDWDGNPATLPHAWKKRNGNHTESEENFDNLNAGSNASDNDYWNMLKNGNAAIGSPIYFFFHIGTANLTEKNQVINIDEIANVAKKHQLRIKVIGAADSATGTETINDAVSRQRAEYIRRLLLDRGVDTDRITMVCEGGTDVLSPFEANRNTCIVLSF